MHCRPTSPSFLLFLTVFRRRLNAGSDERGKEKPLNLHVAVHTRIRARIEKNRQFSVCSLRLHEQPPRKDYFSQLLAESWTDTLRVVLLDEKLLPNIRRRCERFSRDGLSVATGTYNPEVAEEFYESAESTFASWAVHL